MLHASKEDSIGMENPNLGRKSIPDTLLELFQIKEMKPEQQYTNYWESLCAC